MSVRLALATRLETLRDRLERVHFDLGLAGSSEADAVRRELSHQIGDYLVPRLKRLDAPLLAVIGGSTGSGKSTITNTIAGSNVSPSGVLRPTTRSPVLICHPDDEAWFTTAEVLPGLARTTSADDASGAPSVGALRIVTVESLLPGLALVDAPDIDSVEDANRALATQLLAAADLWLFVTTAVRYADAVPWQYLRRAADRGTSLALIVNRVPEGAGAEIVPHLQSMLEEAGLRDLPVFDIEQGPLEDERLPAGAIVELEQLIRGLAADAEVRAQVVGRTLDGALASVAPRARTVGAAASEQDGAAEDLRLAIEQIFQRTREDIGRDLGSGALLRGEVLDRWQELIGTNEMMRAIQSRITAVRDRLTGFLRGRAGSTDEVRGEITSTLETLLVDRADEACLAVTDQWRSLPGGAAVLHGRTEKLARASDEFRAAIAYEIRGWQDDILDLVRERGAGKRNMARVMAFGVNGVGVALMIVLFAQTGGITGGEVAVASGTATVSQALLNALFGEQAVRELADEARANLLDRVGRLLDGDANRFRTALWETVTPPDLTAELEEAIHLFAESQT